MVRRAALRHALPGLLFVLAGVLLASPAAATADPPGCTSGAMTLGDRDFPEAGNGGYDVTNYDINIRYVNVGNTILPGTHTTVTAIATQDLCDFTLDFDGMTVTAVTVDGAPATFTRVAPPGGAPPCTTTGACTAGNNSTTLVYPPPDGCSPSFGNPNSTVIPGDTQHRGCPPSKLKITPAAVISAGEAFEVDVAYNGVPKRHRDADGTEEGWLNTPNGDGTFNVNEPIGAMTWLPSNNHPADKATFEFHITIPTCSTNPTLNPGLPTVMPCFRKSVITNGELVDRVDNGCPAACDGTTTWNWQMTYPMATYLSAVTIGDFDVTDTTIPAATFPLVGGLRLINAIDSTFTPTQKTNALNGIANEPTVMERETAAFGPFPWDSYGVVADAAGAIGYVLEVQSRVHFPSSSISLSTLAHETGHQWFGNSVSLESWNEIFMNEGWATFTDWWYNATYTPGAQTLAQRFAGQYTAGSGTCPGNNKWCVAPVDVDARNLFSTFPVYSRGATMLVALKGILGDDRFWLLTNRWTQENAYGNASAQDFRDLAMEVASRPFISPGEAADPGLKKAQQELLDKFFDQWIEGHSQPTITHLNFYGPSFVTSPTLIGSGVAGKQLRCDPGDSSEPAELSFAWRRDGVAIDANPDRTYMPDDADVGSTISCTMTRANETGSRSATTNGILITARTIPPV